MMWTSEMKWSCSNDLNKLVTLSLGADTLSVRFAQPNIKQRTTSKSIPDLTAFLFTGSTRQLNKDLRVIAEQILLYFGLSYAEETKITTQIRQFVQQIL